jgi:hypothetical protein
MPGEHSIVDHFLRSLIIDLWALKLRITCMNLPGKLVKCVGNSLPWSILSYLNIVPWVEWAILELPSRRLKKLSRSLWKSLRAQLSHWAINGRIKEFAPKRKSREAVWVEPGEIIAHLTRGCSGNVPNYEVVEGASSEPWSGEPHCAAKNAGDFGTFHMSTLGE